jgi:hypothetical protein
MYESTTGIRRKSSGYTGLFATPFRVDFPGMGSDDHEPCEDRRPRNEFATRNNQNDFERIDQFRREALSSEIAKQSREPWR